MSEVKCSTYPDWLRGDGRDVRLVEGVKVRLVPFSTPAHIRYEKYTRDLTRRRAKPYLVGKTGYATLESAVRAVFKNGFTPL